MLPSALPCRSARRLAQQFPCFAHGAFVLGALVDALDLSHLGVLQALLSHIGEGTEFCHGGGRCTAQIVWCPLAAGQYQYGCYGG